MAEISLDMFQARMREPLAEREGPGEAARLQKHCRGSVCLMEELAIAEHQGTE